MARVKKKPLRGSVRQNTLDLEENGPRFTFGVRLALMVIGAIGMILLISWVWNSEWPRTLKAKVEQATLKATQKAGFAVADVIVEGRHYTDRTTLYYALGVEHKSPVFAFDPVKAHENIMNLPWTESVTVLRSMPNKIIIKLKERQPMARWQHNDQTIVIDSQGKPLTAAKPEQFAHLPLVVGMAAPEQTQTLLSLLQEFPVVADALKAAVRVGERRWNFFLRPNLLIRLPEHQTENALTKLTQLIQEQKILDRNIISVDLRIPDRMVIDPGTQPSEPNYGDTQ